MRSLYKGILLDIDNTMYDYHHAHTAALSAACDYAHCIVGCNEQVVQDTYTKAREEIHAELIHTASSHNRLLYFQRMYEMLSENALKHSLDTYNVYWDTFLRVAQIRPGVYDFFKHMNNATMCIVTDLTAHIQHKKMHHFKLYEYVDYIVTSEEVGVEKPHPSIFKRALHKMNLGPHEVCMIGDDFAKDIIGAIGLHIRSFWLDVHAENRNIPELVTRCTSFQELMESMYA